MRIVGGKTPIDSRLNLIALLLPGLHLLLHSLRAGHALRQTLSRKHREFNLGHVEPTAMGRSVMDLQFLTEPQAYAGSNAS